MTIIDVAQSAASLRVVDVWKPGNETGIVTDPGKYFKRPGPYDRAVRHVTVGTNSLSWLAGTGTVACIPYLIPTKASDGHADNWTVYKLIPSDSYGYHVGDMEWRGETESDWHPKAWGVEIENIGDFRHEIEQRQYLKFALIYAYDCAVHRWQDTNVFDHSTIAIPHGRRTDPQAGLFRESVWWDYVWEIRDNWPWPSVARWDGGSTR